MPTEDDQYTTTPTHVRLWAEGQEWFLDGADDEGRYTEACWSYDTFSEAVAAIPEFTSALTEDYGYSVKWNASRPRGFHWRKQKEVED